jgi:hypothetical protein
MRNIIKVVSVLFFSLFSSISFGDEGGFFSDLIDSAKEGRIEDVFERRKIRNWYQENKGKLVIVDDTSSLSCNSYSRSGALAADIDCVFEAQIVNHTSEKLAGIIVEITTYNKSKNKRVTQEILGLPVDILPSARLPIKVSFRGRDVGDAWFQLGSNFLWSYKLIAYLPGPLFCTPIYIGSYKPGQYSSSMDFSCDYEWM